MLRPNITLRIALICAAGAIAAFVRRNGRYVSRDHGRLVILLCLCGGLAGWPPRTRSAQAATPRHPFTPATVDARCFGATSPSAVWPLAPARSTHAIRGGFNDPRSAFHAHTGVDIESGTHAAVYAMVSGQIRSIVARGHSEENFLLGRFNY